MKHNFSSITIPEILEVGIDTIKNAGKYLVKANIKKMVVFYGEGMKDMFGKDFMDSVNKQPNLDIIKEFVNEDINLNAIIENAFDIPKETQAIVGIGGGKVLDVAKYVAFLNNILFISIPTSTSHDGFASSGCSLYINNKRTSVSARMPYGIIVDIGIIKRSPERFVFSGIGDIISKITAVRDWKFEEDNNKTKVSDFAVMISKKSVNSIARMPFKDIKEDFFLKELVDSLTMSGIAMEMAGNSAPASGSEHLISHALDQILDKNELHGIQVGIATYIMSLVQQHRYVRVNTFLRETGFWEYVKTLNLEKDNFIKAIDLAPSIKPTRYTYIHLEENRKKAKEYLHHDPVLNTILR
ncbi:iron-containing alcohol dehydrogenase family protein [Herbivorax sp. ANBcel31]|uniref:iron-containing alcohol dehydrogenase family protein n=1 Tax=Herbivorax sp. ANBcel31 TaxID=3069754 RepID=UPI0027AF2172|nr:iron-containing alcohol dehydrogenase family protein [Herbivorax sp. ANBcel31]MDQ2085207.1 iron-containing alcohol dehydrogenase family protein [Herbivorax sp. ANBcel31]